jgi:hypothetical protein
VLLILLLLLLLIGVEDEDVDEGDMEPFDTFVMIVLVEEGTGGNGGDNC